MTKRKQTWDSTTHVDKAKIGYTGRAPIKTGRSCDGIVQYGPNGGKPCTKDAYVRDGDKWFCMQCLRRMKNALIKAAERLS